MVTSRAVLSSAYNSDASNLFQILQRLPAVHCPFVMLHGKGRLQRGADSPLE